MRFLRKLLLWLLALLLAFTGFWLVVGNAQRVDINLLLLAFPDSNLGLALLLAFAGGSLLGLVLGLNLLPLLSLQQRLLRLKREVRLLQDVLGDKRSP